LQERLVRGINEGKGDVIVDAALQVNSGAQRAYEVNQSGSHTLQSRDFEDREALRARLIEATVEAIAEGSDPRLNGSRL
jgi:hypothetical protein